MWGLMSRRTALNQRILRTAMSYVVPSMRPVSVWEVEGDASALPQTVVDDGFTRTS